MGHAPIIYVESPDVPKGMTLDEYRRRGPQEHRRPKLLARLRERTRRRQRRR